MADIENKPNIHEQIQDSTNLVEQVRKLANQLDDPKNLAELTKYLENKDQAIAQLSKGIFQNYAQNLIPHFQTEPNMEKERIAQLSDPQKKAILTYARLYDGDNGLEIDSTDPKMKDGDQAIARVLARLSILESTKAKVSTETLQNRFATMISKDAKEPLSTDQRSIIDAKTLDALTSGDIYALRQAQFDLSRLFLVDHTTGQYPEGKDTETKGKIFVVNFGGNNALNRSVGAGDILSDEVSEVKINGVTGRRSYDADKRPGYYDENGKYLRIYSGYTIDIMNSGPMSDEQKSESSKSHQKRFQEIRFNEIIDTIDGLSDENHFIKPKSNTEADKKALSDVLKATFGIELDPKDIDPEKGVDLGSNGPHKEKVAEYKKRRISPEREGTGGIPIDGIVSSGIARSPETGNTLCSRTVRMDAARIFGVTLPSGDAIKAQDNYGPIGPRNGQPMTIQRDFGTLPSEANFADVFTGSRSSFGHRCLAFKKGNEWMILDPYIAKTNNPVPLDSYPRKNQILKVAGYKIDQKKSS